MSQPGVNANDYEDKEASPWLRRLIAGDDKAVRSSLAIPDVRGTFNAEKINEMLETKCDAEHVRLDASSKSQGNITSLDKRF